MFEAVKTDDTLFAKILREIEKHKKDNKRSYPKELVDMIINYITKTNMTIMVASSKLGISHGTIGRWLNEQSSMSRKPKLATKEVTEDRPNNCNSVDDNNDGDIVVEVDYKGMTVRTPLRALGGVVREIGKIMNGVK